LPSGARIKCETPGQLVAQRGYHEAIEVLQGGPGGLRPDRGLQRGEHGVDRRIDQRGFPEGNPARRTVRGHEVGDIALLLPGGLCPGVEAAVAHELDQHRARRQRGLHVGQGDGFVLRTELRARRTELSLEVVDACAQGRDGRGALRGGASLGGAVELRDERRPGLGELIELVAERGREVVPQRALRFGERIEDTALAAQHGGQGELQRARATRRCVDMKRHQPLGLALDERHHRPLARRRQGGEVAAQLRLSDVGGTRQKGLGLGVRDLSLVEPREVMEGARDVGMQRPQRLLVDV
jgi:hypothetical protein